MRRRMFLRGVGIDISLSIHKLTSVRLGWSAGVSADHDASLTIMSALGYGVEPRRSIQREAMMSLPRLNSYVLLAIDRIRAEHRATGGSNSVAQIS